MSRFAHSCWATAWVTAVAGCAFNSTVEDASHVICQSGSDCPAPWNCQPATHRCVRPEAFDDLTPSQVGAAELTYEARLTSLAVRPTALGPASVAVVRLTSSEALASQELRACAGVRCDLTQEDSPSFTYSCHTQPGAQPPSSCPLRWTMSDAAGNASTVPEVALLRIDVEAPTPPPVDEPGAILVVRQPWGSLASPETPRVHVTVNRMHPDERIIAYRPSTPTPIAVGAEGALSVELPVVDATALELAYVDRAGNQTSRVAVREFELTLSLGTPAGSPGNATHLTASPADTAGFAPHAGTTLTAPNGVAAVDNTAYSSIGAGMWRERFPSSRVPPHFAAMAYDEARARTVAWGGCFCWPGSYDEPGSKVVEWNGEDWVERDPLDPEGDGNAPPTMRAALAYDGRANVTLVFGGRTRTGVSDEFWAWNGVSWTRKSPPLRPPAREGHQMVWDPRRSGVVLFGGRRADGGFLDDTWVWTNDRWSQLRSPQSPVARADHRMTWDDARRVVTLTGGETPGGVQWDPWVLDADGWRPDEALAPKVPPRSGHAFVYDAARGSYFVQGGRQPDGGVWNDVWEYVGGHWLESDGGLLSRSTTSAASPHDAHAYGMAFYDRARSATTIIGGQPLDELTPDAGNLATVLQQLSKNLVTLVRAPGGLFEVGANGITSVFKFSARVNHAMAWDDARGVTVVNGGEYGPYTLDDTFEWDGRSATMWLSPDGGPVPNAGPRTHHAMAYDHKRGGMILFGGTDEPGSTQVETATVRSVFVDAGTWFGSPDGGWSRLSIQSPPARFGHAMQWNPISQKITLVGGQTFAYSAHELRLNGLRSRFADTWELGTTWQSAPSAANNLCGAALAFDSTRGVEIAFPGRTYDSFFLQYTPAVYERPAAGGPWSELRPSLLPAHRSYENLIYDTRAQRTLHYGVAQAVVNVFDDVTSSTLLDWDGVRWSETRVSDAEGLGSPGRRAGFRWVYDQRRGRAVLFGGTLPDLWEFDLAPRRPVHIFEADLVSSGVPEGAELTRLTFQATAKGEGFTPMADGGWAPQPGVALTPWLDGHWADELARSSVDGGETAVVLVAGWSTRANGIGGKLHARLAPLGVNGPGYARLETDAMSAVVTYRLPAATVPDSGF